jgi:hypothetical protein
MTVALDRGARIAGFLIYLAIINFVLFSLMSLYLGGDALNGKAEAGHYYLASHGRLTEVSYQVFTYSKLHAYTLFVTHPIGIIAGIVWTAKKLGRRKAV